MVQCKWSIVDASGSICNTRNPLALAPSLLTGWSNYLGNRTEVIKSTIERERISRLIDHHIVKQFIFGGGIGTWPLGVSLWALVDWHRHWCVAICIMNNQSLANQDEQVYIPKVPQRPIHIFSDKNQSEHQAVQEEVSAPNGLPKCSQNASKLGGIQ